MPRGNKRTPTASTSRRTLSATPSLVYSDSESTVEGDVFGPASIANMVSSMSATAPNYERSFYDTVTEAASDIDDDMQFSTQGTQHTFNNDHTYAPTEIDEMESSTEEFRSSIYGGGNSAPTEIDEDENMGLDDASEGHDYPRDSSVDYEEDSRSDVATEVGSVDQDEDMESVAEKIYDRFPLREYLLKAGLPLFKHVDQPSLLELKDYRFAPEWSAYRNLRRDPQTDPRGLKKVSRMLTRVALTRVIKADFERFSADEMKLRAAIQDEEKLTYHMPCKGIVGFDKEDKVFLGAVKNGSHMSQLFKHYVLDTVSATTRLMRLYPPGVNCLEFKPSNHFCDMPHRKWDIFTLPALGSTPKNEKFSIAIVFVPPWEFGSEDFKQFIAEKNFSDNSLDLLDSKLKKNIASDVMWSVLYETLKGRGTKFVFTNYIDWAFGSFNPDWTQAEITKEYRANLTDVEGNTTWAPYKGATVLELLSLWTYRFAERPIGY